MNIKEKKLEYNLIIEEYQSGVTYLDSLEISMEQKEKAIPSYKKLLREMDEELKWFDNNEVKYTEEEALGGFKI